MGECCCLKRITHYWTRTTSFEWVGSNAPFSETWKYPLSYTYAEIIHPRPSLNKKPRIS